MLIPDASRKPLDRLKEDEPHCSQRRSRSDEDSPFTFDFRLGNKPSNVILILAVMVVAGGLLIGRVSSRFSPAGGGTAESAARRELDVLRIAVERFRRDCGRYPETSEGLMALIKNPGIAVWKGPYVSLVKPDPWRNSYCYRLVSGHVVLVSRGPDGVMNTVDDLTAPDACPDDTEF